MCACVPVSVLAIEEEEGGGEAAGVGWALVSSAAGPASAPAVDCMVGAVCFVCMCMYTCQGKEVEVK